MGETEPLEVVPMLSTPISCTHTPRICLRLLAELSTLLFGFLLFCLCFIMNCMSPYTSPAAGLETNGFSFEGTDPAGLDYALNRALSAWYSDRPWWNNLASRVMHQDWSWDGPALDYVELYYKALKGFV